MRVTQFVLAIAIAMLLFAGNARPVQAAAPGGGGGGGVVTCIKYADCVKRCADLYAGIGCAIRCWLTGCNCKKKYDSCTDDCKKSYPGCGPDDGVTPQ